MNEMNNILEERLTEVENQFHNDDKIYANFQKALLDQVKMKGTKNYSDKRFDDFDTIVWPKVKQLRDHRQILISITGYQLDEENIKVDIDNKKTKTKLDPETGEPISKRFQAYSQVLSQVRKAKHEKCYQDTPTYQFIKNPKIPISKDIGTSPGKPETSSKPISQDTPKFIITMKDKLSSIGGETSNQDYTMRPSNEATGLHSKPTQSPKKSLTQISQADQEKLSPRDHLRVANKKSQRKRRQTVIDSDGIPEEDKETILRREREHAEYLKEEQEYRRRMVLESISKKPQEMIEDLKLRLNEVTEDIKRYEQLSDDEFDLYENNVITNAYANAKIRVHQKALMDNKWRARESGHQKSKEEIKIQIYGTESQASARNNSLSPTFRLTTIPISKSSQPMLSNSPFSPRDNKPPLDYPTEAAPSQNAYSVGSGRAVPSDRLARSLKKMESKEQFAKLMAEVYEKTEEVDYGAKSKRKMKQLQRHDALQNGDDEGEEAGSNYANEGGNSPVSASDTDSEMERQFMMDQFKKEEERENEIIRVKLIEEQKKNMQKKYLQMCKNEKVVPLPIVNKIFDGVLYLDDYKLNFGLCKALGNVLDDLGDTIYKIDLRNNGITDSDFAEVIKGALQNPQIKSICLRKNEFKEQSLEQLMKYFEMKTPVLQELALVANKTKLSQMSELLKNLSNYTYLKQLALCQVKLDKQCMQYLADIANANPLLRELDLSWNYTSASNMLELVQNIEFCRNISFLNLSFNSFVCSRTEDIVQSLCNFIKINRKLQHLDISYCGLRKDEVFEVVKACKKSRSLLAIHLSGNFITEETRQKIREFMRPRKRIKNLYDQINNPDEVDDNPAFKIGNIDLQAAIKAKLKQYHEGDQDEEEIEALPKSFNNPSSPKVDPGETLIFSRILGHFEIPHSYNWQESSSCWICQRFRYSVILVSQSIADTFFIQPRNKDKKIFLDKIQNAQDKRNENPGLGVDFHQYGSDEDEVYYDADTEDAKTQIWKNNHITGTFTKWKTQSLLPLGEFMRRIKKNQEPSVTVVQIEKSMYDKQVEDHREQLRKKEEAKRQLRRQGMTMFRKQKLILDKEDKPRWSSRFTEIDYRNVRNTSLFELQQLIPYKESANFIIGLDKVFEMNQKDQIFTQMKEKIYVYADFLPPGKHNTCLIYNTPNEPKKGMYTFLVNVRHRELPLNLLTKKVREYRIQRKFDKPVSMFKDFPDDTPANLKKMFLKDIETWKLGRVIKDGFELRNLIEALTEYIAQIKDIFNYSIALSSYPSISWIDFGNLCHQWKLPDNRSCNMTTIDRVFIATNVELVDQEDNPDRDLCRFEFFEILCRLGAAKYKDSGLVSTWDAAARSILTKNLIPYTDVMGGQSFREKYIWNLPIDDLFRANLEGVTKLFKKHSSDHKKNLDMEGCLEIAEDLQLSEQEVKQAYSFSKMTILDEMNQKDRYDTMLLPEFMDFLCRCAYFKYKEMPQLAFVQKVERILDIMLKQVEMRRERPNFEIDVSSDSDYESDD